MTNKLPTAALYYAEKKSWAIFPLIPLTKKPATAHGFKDASRDADTIRAWWKDTPNANIGLATGEIVVLDFDVHKPDFAGAELLALLTEEYPTATADTPRGGVHLFFAARPGSRLTNARGKLPAGIDVRGHGGYVAIAPSVFVGDDPTDPFYGKTGVYKWREGCKPRSIELAPIPLFVVDQILAAGEAGKRPDGKIADGVIADFNREHKIADILTAHGYTVGRKDTDSGLTRLARPGKPATETSVVIALVNGVERSYHHSTSDALHTDGHARDAFDVWVHLEHAGDSKAAYVAAKQAQGKWEDRTSGTDTDTGKTATADTPKTEPADTATADTAGGKPTINVNQQLSELVRDALRAVIHANNEDPQHPVLYVRAGTLARVLTDERGRASIVPVDAGALLAILAEVAIWIAETKRGIADQKVPQSVVTAFLNQADWPGLPVLEGVSMAPVFGHDGSLHAKHGYDPVTQIFNASTLEIERTEPTPEAIQAALSLFFDDMLHDFPFVDAASKAHALALVLLPFCRHMIDGATPLHLISAPAHGAGKSLLAECTLLPAYGREPAATPEARSSDEWSKLLTTVLMDGRPIVFLDNVARPLEGSGMATALTQAFWSDRILGVNRTVNAPIRCVWVASAKNPVASAEIARRCCLIRIDPNTENPEDRTGFKHPHLKRWILENRARLVGAAVTIVQNWVRRGMPIWKGSVKGSYESWTEIVGGILEAAGVPGFLENETAMRESAPETVAMRKFVETWFAVFGEKETTAKDLFPLAASAEDENAIDADSYLGLLAPQLGSGNRKSQQTRLGSLLARSVDAVFSGLKIVRCEKDSRDGGKMYRLAVIDPKRGTFGEKVPRESPEVETVSRNLRNLTPATCEVEKFLHNVGDISQYSERLEKGSAGSANGTATRGSARGTLPEGSAVAAYLGRVLMVTELPDALTAAQADGVKVTQSPVQGGWRIELA